MPNSEKSLDVLVRIMTQELGDRKAEEILKKAGEATGDLAKEMGVVTASAEEAEKILNKTGEAAKQTGRDATKGGEGVHEFNVHGRELNHLAGMLNRILPGTGEALKAIGHSGDEGAMMMIGLASVVEIVSKSLEQMSENARKADEGLAAIVDEKYDTEATRQVADAWNNAATAHDLYVRSLREHHEDDNDPSKGPMDRAARTAKEAQSEQQKIDDAQKKLGEAYIDELENHGVITHARALAAKLQLDEQYEQRKLALVHQADQQELDIKQKTVDIVQKQKADATTNEADAEKKSGAAEAGVAHVKMEIDKSKQDKAAAQAEMDKSGVTKGDAANIREYYEKAGGVKKDASLQDMADYLRILINNPLNPSNDKKLSKVGVEGVNDLRGMFTSWMTGGKDITDAQVSAYEGGEQVDKKSDAALVRLNAQLATREHEAAEAKAELDRQKHLLDEKTGQLDKLQQEVDELKATQQAKEANAATVAGIDAQTAGVKNGQRPAVNPLAPPPTAARAALPKPAPIREHASAAGPADDAIGQQSVQMMTNAINQSHDHAKTIAALAARLVQQQEANNAQSLLILRIVNEGMMKHESVAQIVKDLEARMNTGK